MYDVALLDLDGVVYVGEAPVEHAAQALREARARDMRLAFVTNNASRTPAIVAAHLTRIGIHASEQEVVTSAQAAARLLAEQLPRDARVLVVGGAGLHEAVRERGLAPVTSLEEDTQAVVQGFSPDVDWRALAEGAYAVARGLPWVASNIDRTIPTARGVAPGNGALVDAVRAATGRDPVVAGKPEPPMHREAMVRTGAHRPLVVGDRLDTDIDGARRAGSDSLLVLTGVTSPEELVMAPPQLRPTYVGADLRALHQQAPQLGVEPGRDQCGGWTATIEAGTMHLHRSAVDGTDTDEVPEFGTSGVDLDALRAVCGAAWAYRREIDAESIRRVLRMAGDGSGNGGGDRRGHL
ncbi:HAD-IIA family hydrolase [Actinobacteria bacterium YIM 96077]|uniref:HAD family hydrolase n=2 Tax=Phytoactinopolyspora halophila TaxID=1981511 RepID=A0A329QJT8_9ACTN|nr:HAD-IIA family hydrolase [Actinobacteria bacterium YIM 96077]RAW10758.1 HAD family hydrolase [Phytoactinopolyspora halophila]